MPNTGRKAVSVRRTSSRWCPWCAAAACAALVGCGFGSSRSTGNPGEPDGGGVGPPDAAADAAIDDSGGGPGGGPHAFCVGPTDRSICLDAAPTGSVELGTAIDTDKSDADNPCLAHQPASWTAALGPDACFVVGDTVRIAALVATGSRPLVIVAQHQITVATLLSVASPRIAGETGAGANPTDCKPFSRDPSQEPMGGGGGAGGSFMVTGGDGGAGNSTNNLGGLAAAADGHAPTRLRGGCAGQKGGRGVGNDGGAGGGAIYLVSAGAIDLQGKIDASGAGGKGAGVGIGGGGGGSGGMILLLGATVTAGSSAVLLANGGGGGGGGAAVTSTTTNPLGQDGNDPGSATAVATGGHGGIVISQNGGNGGNGAALQTAPTQGDNCDTGAGGGGGGGGVGYIRSNRSLDGAMVSPAADVVP
jgi:hypothetical protein